MRGADSVVTIVESQLDFEGAIVLQFGRAIARDLVAYVEVAPSEKDDSSAVFDFGGGLDGTKGKFCPTVSFARVFRKVTGLAPGAHRKRFALSALSPGDDAQKNALSPRLRIFEPGIQPG